MWNNLNFIEKAQQRDRRLFFFWLDRLKTLQYDTGSLSLFLISPLDDHQKVHNMCLLCKMMLLMRVKENVWQTWILKLTINKNFYLECHLISLQSTAHSTSRISHVHLNKFLQLAAIHSAWTFWAAAVCMCVHIAHSKDVKNATASRLNFNLTVLFCVCVCAEKR